MLFHSIQSVCDYNLDGKLFRLRQWIVKELKFDSFNALHALQCNALYIFVDRFPISKQPNSIFINVSWNETKQFLLFRPSNIADVNMVAEPKPHQIGRKRQNVTKTGNDWDYYYDRWVIFLFFSYIADTRALPQILFI